MDDKARIDLETKHACLDALAQIAEFKEALELAFEKLFAAVDDPTDGTNAAIEAFHELVSATDEPTLILVSEYRRLTGVHLPTDLDDDLPLLSGRSFFVH